MPRRPSRTPPRMRITGPQLNSDYGWGRGRGGTSRAAPDRMTGRRTFDGRDLVGPAGVATPRTTGPEREFRSALPTTPALMLPIIRGASCFLTGDDHGPR